jgi:hypothetical protein
MENILFKCKINIDSDTFNQIMKEKSKPAINKPTRFLLVLCAGIACLFFSYTIILGIIIISITLLTLFLPKFIPWSYLGIYKQHTDLHEEIEYILTDNFIYINSNSMSVKISWGLIYSISTLSNWILIGFAGSPTIYIPHQEMQNSPYYHEIIMKLKKLKIKGRKEIPKEIRIAKPRPT